MPDQNSQPESKDPTPPHRWFDPMMVRTLKQYGEQLQAAKSQLMEQTAQAGAVYREFAQQWQPNTPAFQALYHELEEARKRAEIMGKQIRQAKDFPGEF